MTEASELGDRAARLYQLAGRVLWWALLVAVPVTSFPPFVGRLGGKAISPLSILPMMLLLLGWVLPAAIRGERFRFPVWPLLTFVLMGLISTVRSPYLGIKPFKSFTPLATSVDAAVTVIVGLGFFLVSLTALRRQQGLRWTMAALYLGALLALIWGGFQAEHVIQNVPNVPQRLNAFHRLFSTRDLFRDRITGFAFEPSWFGNQFVILYLPIWLAALLTGESILGWKEKRLTVELLAVPAGVAGLLLARSRLSLVSLGVVLLVFAGPLLWRASGRLEALLRRRRQGAGAGAGGLSRGAILLLGVLALSLILGAGMAGVLRSDPRMRRAFQLGSQMAAIREAHPFDFPYEVAHRMAFAERLVYWTAALRVFDRHPLLGVGLGNSGLLLKETIPAYGYQLTEVRAYLRPTHPNLPTPKNLWIRLSAETGLVGASLFLAWLTTVGLCAVGLAKSDDRGQRWIGWAGILSLSAQLFEGFSIDSFALPQLWLITGMVVAATGWGRTRRTAGVAR